MPLRISSSSHCRAWGDVGSRGGSSSTGSASPGGAGPRGRSALLGRVDQLDVEPLAADALVDGQERVDPGGERGGDGAADQGGAPAEDRLPLEDRTLVAQGEDHGEPGEGQGEGDEE